MYKTVIYSTTEREHCSLLQHLYLKPLPILLYQLFSPHQTPIPAYKSDKLDYYCSDSAAIV